MVSFGEGSPWLAVEEEEEDGTADVIQVDEDRRPGEVVQLAPAQLLRPNSMLWFIFQILQLRFTKFSERKSGTVCRC